MAPKNKKNSFYYFMLDVQEREEARGHRIPMKSMAQYAHPLWVKLSSAEKQKYEQRANMHKNDPQLQSKKLASDGTSIEDNLRCLEEVERRKNEQMQEIKTYVNSNGMPKEQFIEFASRRVLYFISFNILCRTEKEYIPIEVGVVEYSIEHGIHRELSMLIHSGSIPTGYAAEALRLKEKHDIDVFQGEETSVKDMKKVYHAIKKFVNPYDSEEYPPLFCHEDDIEKNIGCLEWLAKKTRDHETFGVWNAKYLLLELRAGAEEPLPSITIAYDLLNKASFNYHSEARCDFHDEKDCQDCALAYSKRLCYLLSDAVCPVFNIQLTEKHMPSRSLENNEYVVYRPSDDPMLDKYFEPRSYRFDQRKNYHVNKHVEGQFSDAPEDSKPPSNAPRQPASSCIAEEMNRLKLNMTSATVPGHGIGRGQRWK